jgi:hypothetical protein
MSKMHINLVSKVAQQVYRDSIPPVNDGRKEVYV